MAQMSITAKIQVVASDEDKALLDETMSVYREACNYVSDYVFRTHDLKQFSLNKALYPTLRAEFGLKFARKMTQSVFKTVIARYKTILENQKEWIKPSFKKPQYDLVWNRDYSLTQDRFSINTLGGRVKLPYFAKRDVENNSSITTLSTGSALPKKLGEQTRENTSHTSLRPMMWEEK